MSFVCKKCGSSDYPRICDFCDRVDDICEDCVIQRNIVPIDIVLYKNAVLPYHQADICDVCAGKSVKDSVLLDFMIQHRPLVNNVEELRTEYFNTYPIPNYEALYSSEYIDAALKSIDMSAMVGTECIEKGIFSIIGSYCIKPYRASERRTTFSYRYEDQDFCEPIFVNDTLELDAIKYVKYFVIDDCFSQELVTKSELATTLYRLVYVRKDGDYFIPSVDRLNYGYWVRIKEDRSIMPVGAVEHQDDTNIIALTKEEQEYFNGFKHRR